MRSRDGLRRAGFTLVELLVVITIIGIIMSLILVAAADGVRRAEERATQSLITKLDVAVSDRIDALFNSQAPINQTHRYLAAINFPNAGVYLPTPNSVEQRAQVIAQNDYIRAEFPDVFFRNDLTSDGATLAGQYPLNFAAVPYPSGTKTIENFVVPLGNTQNGLPFETVLVEDPMDPMNPPIPTKQLTSRKSLDQGIGIFGASYSAAAGIYKNLGYRKQAYDGVDNLGNGLVDEKGENNFSAAELTEFNARLNNHTHKTARSEMLYAVLVEGLGPLGSVFAREDFTDKEVRDTDGDGLPEFVDAWGEPLQFFRWPIYYGTVTSPTEMEMSDSQLGYGKYDGRSETREQDPLDPNQLLVAPGWWDRRLNPALPLGTALTTGDCSPGAIAFMTYFRSLIDPMTLDTDASKNVNLWDRSGVSRRRAYFSKFLILSAGPDREPGVAQLGKEYAPLLESTASPSIYTFPNSTRTMQENALALIRIENQAAPADPSGRTGTFSETPNDASAISLYLKNYAGTDDITNHNISAPGTGVR